MIMLSANWLLCLCVFNRLLPVSSSLLMLLSLMAFFLPLYILSLLLSPFNSLVLAPLDLSLILASLDVALKELMTDLATILRILGLGVCVNLLGTTFLETFLKINRSSSVLFASKLGYHLRNVLLGTSWTLMMRAQLNLLLTLLLLLSQG